MAQNTPPSPDDNLPFTGGKGKKRGTTGGRNSSSVGKRTSRVDPLRDYRFNFYVEGLDGMGFQEVRGMGIDLGEFEYEEGGRNLSTMKFLGKVKFSDITLTKGLLQSSSGVAEDSALSSWAFQRMNAENVSNIGGVGITSPVFLKRMCLLQILDKTGKPQKEYVIYDAFVKKFELGRLSATGNGVAIQKLVIGHNGWEDEDISAFARGVGKGIELMN